jgi:hypothetical protein
MKTVRVGMHGRRPRKERPPLRLAVPRKLLKDELGLGQLIRRMTDALQIPSCGGCRRRAEILDAAVVFRPRATEGSTAAPIRTPGAGDPRPSSDQNVS